MGCVTSTEQVEENARPVEPPKEEHRAEPETGDGANDERPALQKLDSSATATDASFVFETAPYVSQRPFIINNAQAPPHLYTADYVDTRLQKHRAELAEHKNTILTNAQKAYFAEQKTWNELLPEQQEMFYHYEPKILSAVADMPKHVPQCTTCAKAGHLMIASCPWSYKKYCHHFEHPAYNVIFGYEKLFACRSCKALEEESSKENRHPIQ